jgi:hypothetical protein
VQEELVSCKEDARGIAEEHARVEEQRSDAIQFEQKAGLLTA